jgi:hypothetical protein
MKGARMTTEDTYEISAKYYDGAYEANEELDDVPFYVELAGREARRRCGRAPAHRSMSRRRSPRGGQRRRRTLSDTWAHIRSFDGLIDIV